MYSVLLPQNKISDAANELRLVRTILERLECSFARLEARLDRLLGMMSQLPQPPRFSTSDASVSHKIALDRPFSATVPTPVGAVSENTLQQRQLRSPENAAA